MEDANFADEEVKAVLEHFQKTTPSTFKETVAKLVELGLASEAGLLNARGKSIVALLQGPATYTKEEEWPSLTTAITRPTSPGREYWPWGWAMSIGLAGSILTLGDG